MKWLYNRPCWKEKGFTLIELLIVIIILAVLAGIAIPSYLSITNRAKESATEAEMSSIATALEMYNADKGIYPDTGLVAMTTALEADPAYMAKVPQNDKWSHLYAYAVVGKGYTLTSGGKDGATTTGDNIIFTNGQMTQAGN